MPLNASGEGSQISLRPALCGHAYRSAHTNEWTTLFLLWLSPHYLFLIYLGVDREIWEICYDFQWEQGPDSLTYYGHRFTCLCCLCKTFIVQQLLFLSLFFTSLLPVVVKVHWIPSKWVKGLTWLWGAWRERGFRTELCLEIEVHVVCSPEWLSSFQQSIYLSSTVCASELFVTKWCNSIHWFGSVAYRFLK